MVVNVLAVSVQVVCFTTREPATINYIIRPRSKEIKISRNLTTNPFDYLHD